jgi:lipid-binding SYLF domain-containing protein
MRIAVHARLTWLVVAVLAFGIAHAAPAAAAVSLDKIDARSKAALQQLFKAQPKAKDFANRADAILVIPKYGRGGFIIGGGYGQGALMQGGRIVDHYEAMSGSVGLQAGYQERDQIIMFMTPEALQSFKDGKDWEFGVDASFAVIDTGLGGTISVADFNVPVVVFINDARGLMGSLALSADRYTRIEKQQ